jgi:hypothetical protein
MNQGEENLQRDALQQSASKNLGEESLESPGDPRNSQESPGIKSCITGNLTAKDLNWIEAQSAQLPAFPRLLILILLYQVRLLRKAKR